MKKALASLSLLFSLLLAAQAANFYVRAGVSSSGDGSDWNKAWRDFSNINWGSLNGGDTVYVAGGSYGQLKPTKGGGSNPITFARATKAECSSMAGWQDSFDSTVIVTAPSSSTAIYLYDKKDGLVFDGKVWGGIEARYGAGARGKGCEIDGPASSNVTFRYIKAVGPGKITQSGDCRGFDLTPSATGNGGSGMRNVTMSYCEVTQAGDTNVIIASAGGASSITVEYCSLHDEGAINASTWHPNSIYCGTINGGVFRYNKLYNIGVEGLFFNDPNNNNIQVYGNLFYWGTSKDTGARGLEFNKSGNSNILVYGNTWVDLPLGLQCGKTDATFSGCKFQNNIVFNCTTNFKSGWSASYNAYSNGTSEPNTLSNIADPFVAKASYNYHLKAGAAPIGKGANLGAPYNIDMEGNQQPAQWSMGAYVYGGAPGPSPTPTPAPTATPNPTASPTPNPTPTPPPTEAKFAVGDTVVVTASSVNVRETPAGKLLGSHQGGEQGTIVAGPQPATFNGAMVQWYDVAFESDPNGWAGDDNFEKAQAPAPTPTPAPSPTPGVKPIVKIIAPPEVEIQVEQTPP